MEKFLTSLFKSSSGFLPSRLVPALNISMANSSTSIAAIFFILFNTYLSVSVEVGDLNKSVSEIIAAQRRPATSRDGFIPFSKNIFETIVAVEPTGSFLK